MARGDRESSDRSQVPLEGFKGLMGMRGPQKSAGPRRGLCPLQLLHVSRTPRGAVGCQTTPKQAPDHLEQCSAPGGSTALSAQVLPAGTPQRTLPTVLS